MNSESIIDSIKASLLQDGVSDVEVNEEAAFEDTCKKGGSRFNAIILTFFIFIVCFFIVKTLIFLTKEVLFFSPDNYVNDHGAMVMKQPYGVEQHMFMVNTSQYWTNTGIKLLKGDRVCISYSGNFYSDIGDMCESAGNNKTPKYWEDGIKKDTTKDNESTKLCVYSAYEKDTARFGALLLQIQQDESKLVHHGTIAGEPIIQTKRVGEPTCFQAKESGYLYVTTNDILLTQEVCRQIADTSFDRYKEIINIRKDTTNDYNWFEVHKKKFYLFSKKGRKGFYIYNASGNSDTKTPNIDLARDSDSTARDVLRKQLAKDSLMWYRDNAGEYLLTITVKRGNVPVSARFYRFLDEFPDELDEALDGNTMERVFAGILLIGGLAFLFVYRGKILLWIKRAK